MAQQKSRLNLMLVISSVLLTCCAAECLIRLFPKLYCTGYKLSGNPKLVYELKPGYDITSLNARINSQGLHDRVFSIKKPLGIYRIAVVGDSMSFGWGVGALKSFPKRLEGILNAQGKKTFEIINFSVPGYNTAQELELLKDRVIRFNPDLVIVVFCRNDIRMCNYFRPRVTLANYLYHKSYLVHFVLRCLDIKLHPYAAWKSFKKNVLGMFYYEQYIYPYPGLEEVAYKKYTTSYAREDTPGLEKDVPGAYGYMLGYKNYQENLNQIREFLKAQNVVFVSSGFFNGEALAINKALNVPYVVNLKDAFKGIPYRWISLSPRDGHFNERGHYLTASYLADFLKHNVLDEFFRAKP